MRKVFIIGFGSKARQGKDSSAEIIKSLRKDVHILHFADAVKEECSNPKRKLPLITEIYIQGNPMYLILDNDNRFQMFHREQMPKLQKIFDDRDIRQYFAMDEKDGEILQFWGTDFRRVNVDDQYWVKKVDEKIQNIIAKIADTEETEPVYILVPDTRFKNECTYIKSWNATKIAKGLYVNVQRFNEDGTRYVSNDRDPNHPSEVELDTVEPDYYIDAFNLDELKRKVESLLTKIELTQMIEDIEKIPLVYHD